MGKKGSWISAVKKALSFDSNGKKETSSRNSKSKWFKGNTTAETAVPVPSSPPVGSDKTEEEKDKHARSLALATAAAAEAAAAAAKAAVEVVRLTTEVCQFGRSKEEIAAIKIQTAFRGHLARRALQALRGLVRLNSLIHGPSVQRQSMTTLHFMQMLTHAQSQIRARRLRMYEENQVLQRQLQQICEKEPNNSRTSESSCDKVGGDWNASAQSKEEIKAKLQSKEMAAMRRERALAYARTHQKTRNSSSKSQNPTCMAQDDAFWGWSWLERWMATRPWENKTLQDIQVITTDHNNNGPARSSPKTKPPLSTPPPPKAQSTGPKVRPMSPKGSSGRGPDHDSRVGLSVRYEKQRRHSVGSLLRDDESIVSSGMPVSSHIGPTETAKARVKSQVPSRLGNGKSDKGSFGPAAKRQLSYPSSPGARRHSGPAKVDAGSLKGS